MSYFNPKPLALILITSLLTACAGTDLNLKSVVELPDSFEYSLGSMAVDLDRWWLSWEDPQLTELIELALNNNKDLAATRANLESARAMARAARANLGPEVGATATAIGAANRVRNPIGRDARELLGTLDTNLGDKHLSLDAAGLSGGLAASWEPDFFGHKQADIDAATQGVIARAEEWHAAQKLLSTNIANYYSEWMYFGDKQPLSRKQTHHSNS